MAGSTWMAALFPAEANVHLMDNSIVRLACVTFFFFKGSGPHRDLLSSPTRRSPDLLRGDKDFPPVMQVENRIAPAPSHMLKTAQQPDGQEAPPRIEPFDADNEQQLRAMTQRGPVDRKSTRLNSSHLVISYAVFCLNK